MDVKFCDICYNLKMDISFPENVRDMGLRLQLLFKRLSPSGMIQNEPSHKKTNSMLRLNQRCRSAVQVHICVHYMDSRIPLLTLSKVQFACAKNTHV